MPMKNLSIITEEGGGDFPITENAVQRAPRSMAVAKLDARGDHLTWATYLGGTSNRNSYWRGPIDYPSAIAVILKAM